METGDTGCVKKLQLSVALAALVGLFGATAVAGELQGAMDLVQRELSRKVELQISDQLQRCQEQKAESKRDVRKKPVRNSYPVRIAGLVTVPPGGQQYATAQ